MMEQAQWFATEAIMFTIFGASGNTGAVVAKELLAKGKKVRVLMRDEAKGAAWKAQGAEVVRGDVLDEASVAAALAGAEGAYVLTPPDLSSKEPLQRIRRIADVLVAALRERPVAHVTLLSSVGAHLPTGTGPIAGLHYAEQQLATLPQTRSTFVRAAYFMENVLGYAHAMKTDGVLPVFGGGEAYPFPMVATPDIGRVAAEVLLAGAPAANAVVELSGPKEYSFVDAAAAASEILGRKVTATALPIETLVPTFTSFGMSQPMASLYEEMIVAFGKGLGFEGKGVSRRGTVGLPEVLGALRA
jgi:uncharacterized protein YbjT (DUF2867 family)